VIVFDALRVHLSLDQFAAKAHHSNIISVIRIDHHYVTDLHLQVGRSSVKSFAVRFETDFNNIESTLP
jgi:hypothetical protein